MTSSKPTCEFCGQPSTLLCDGRIYEAPNGFSARVPVTFTGKTRSCDKQVCRKCAHKTADIHIHARHGCRWDTLDLCPLCLEAQEKPVEITPARTPSEPPPQGPEAERESK